ncbi:cystathionine gamma-synthase family protein [Marinomonas spartinae]|uniref:cystathionine gamma-synthase family protein n=1 Tax=Marinomonas spartinae TaxID=1792290 RepID=UPI002D7E7C88|nr:cystathionine gamma-synthase family protein [Marinomonas spartinae]
MSKSTAKPFSESKLLHADRRSNTEHGAVRKPLHVSATYAYPSAQALVDTFQGKQSGYVYSRQGNPTGAALEAQINMLEDSHSTCCFTTGMAAISGMMIALLRHGDHIICSQFLFGNTNSFMGTLSQLGVEISFVDATDPQQVASAIRSDTRMVFVETIANPGTQVAALEEIGQLCAQHAILYVVDSTMTTPVLLQSKNIGASLVIHSLSKGIGGHGNALGGSVSDTGLFDWSTYPNIYPAYQKGDPAKWGITQIRKKGLRDMGATLRAEDAHRIATGLETLSLRVKATCDNALALATWLEQQPQIKRVYYPGLASHAQHERAAEVFSGLYGGLLSFELDDTIDCLAFLDRLQMVILSSHLSDTRTLAIPVARTIFWEMGPERRASMGIDDNLIRLSLGLENTNDLIDDFRQALA